MMDADLVRRRVETKYRVSATTAEEMIGSLPTEGLERRTEWVRTTYLDLPDRRLVRAAVRDPRAAVKVRIREYVGDETVWVELKRRDADWSQKRRFRIHRDRIDSFLDGTLQGLESEEDVETLRRIRAAAPGPLSVVGEVRYLRVSIQGGEPRARVTIDRRVTYGVGGREVLEDGAIVEVKHASDLLPEWCEAVVGRRAPVEYSKFGRICRLLETR